MSFLNRIDEGLIKSKSNLIGHENILNNCKKIIDLIHGENEGYLELIEELDIRSINIFHGETGTGKTTLSYALASYTLEKYGSELYEIKIEDVIKTELGKTVENFHKVYDEIKTLCKSSEGVVLFLDEFDRFLVDRNQSNEISELKRALISLMDFFQSISASHKITILATTNHFDALDSAFKRRFSFHYEIECNDESKREYAKSLIDKIPKSMTYDSPDTYIKEANTIADLKRLIREDIVKLIIDEKETL